MPNIDQSDLEDKLTLFLAQIDNENLDKFSKGICSAFAFMNFRADVLDEEVKHAERMEKLIEMNDKAVIQMAVSYQEYKNTYLSLAENQEGKEVVPAMNRVLAALSHDASLLSKQQAENKKINPSLEAKIHSLEAQVRELRAQREKCIQKAIKDKWNSEKLKEIQAAEEIYFYIHSLVVAYDPGCNLFFHIDDHYVNQWDCMEILKLLPADIHDEKTIHPVSKALQLAFNFTEEELTALFSNKLGENTICDGDYIRLDSTDHAIYLSKKNGLFQLYDPGPIEIKPNTPEALVALIKQRFFTEFKTDSTFMPIGISLFTKRNTKQEKLARPNRAALIQAIIDSRRDKNLDARSWDNNTSASIAATFGHVDTMRILIKANANLNIANNKGHTPLWFAAQHGHSDAVQLLIKSKVDCDQVSGKSSTAVYAAAKNGHVSVLKVLIKSKADLNKANKDEQTPLMIAALKGYADAIKILIAANADLYATTDNGATAIYNAAENGHTQVMQLLINAKADLETPLEDGTTPLHIAAQLGHSGIIKALWKAGLDLNKCCKKVTPAIVAAHQDRASVIKQLFECKADLNKPAMDGSTPLHWAIKRASFAAIKALLDCGADLTKADNQGSLPLDCASKEVEAFVILQQLKKNILTHRWGASCPEIFVKQLRRIQIAKNEKKWEAGLQDLITMKTTSTDPAISFLFSKLTTKDGLFNFERFSYSNKDIPEEKPGYHKPRIS